MRIPITKPYFDNKEEKAVIATLRSGWVTQGPKVIELEEFFIRTTRAKYAVATSSATTSLFLSLYVLGIGPGDEVIVPSFTFIATANVIMHVGATPVFVDIDPKTYNIDPEKIETKITKRTKAILPVDQVGLPCDIDAIKKIAKKHKLFVIEDSACAIGSKYKGKVVGAFVDLTCFSFHPRKLITTGDGGMITTNNKELADRARMLRHQGMGVSDLKRHKSTKIIHESYPEVGFNFRLSDIQAAVGVEQMKKLPMFLAKRKKLAEAYTRAFEKNELIIPPFVPNEYEPNWQSYIIRLRKNKKIQRDELMQKLLDAGIATRRGIMSIHREKPYKALAKSSELIESSKASDETVTIPLYPTMTSREQNYVIEHILKITS